MARKRNNKKKDDAKNESGVDSNNEETKNVPSSSSSSYPPPPQETSRPADDNKPTSTSTTATTIPTTSTISASTPEEFIPLPATQPPSSNRRRNVCIVVLGDIGRSPRMRYHAESFAKEGFRVTMIGYEGSGGIPREIKENRLINTVGMKEAPDALKSIPRLLAYPLKVAWLCLVLAYAFLKMVVMFQFIPEFIVVQNPPAIPSLGVCWVYSKVFACDLVVDWHNYGFSILAMGLGDRSGGGKSRNPVLRFATWFEEYFGRKGDIHLCVTRAMKDDLKKRIGVDAVTLYDRPPEQFRSLSRLEVESFWEKFCKEYYPESSGRLLKGIGSGKKNTARDYGIIVSATSWTEDEDFGILLNALEYYEDKKRICDGDGVSNKYPDLIVFITGKGPLKEYYKKKISELELKHVQIYLPWLKHEDYPKLLGCADLGISLHTSSSGLDLPMKVVDMFGCGLPVCAVGFKCVGELVVDGVNGYVFEDSDGLGGQLLKWFEGMGEGVVNRDHQVFKEELVKFQALRWHENWVYNVRPLLGEKR